MAKKSISKNYFVNTKFSDKLLRVARSQQELDELDDESTDIYKSNIIEQYSLRPAHVKSVNDMYLAKFAAYYYKDYKTDHCETVDAQPVLSDDIIEQSHVCVNDDASVVPKQIRLKNTNEVM